MANFASLKVTFTIGTAPLGLMSFNFGTQNIYTTGVNASNPSSGPTFEASTNPLNSANNFRSEFLSDWGPGGVYGQLNCTVSQPIAGPVLSPFTGNPTTYDIVITMQQYVNGNITVIHDPNTSDFTIIQEVKPTGLSVYVSEVSEATSKCANAKFTLTPTNGTAPYQIIFTATNDLVATGLSFDFPRYSPVRDFKLVDANSNEAPFSPPYVRSYSIDRVDQEILPAGSNVRIISKHNQIGVPLTLEYSINNATFQADNLFPLLAPDNYTAYLRDQYGCVTSQAFTVTAFQFQKIVAVHNTLNFEIKQPEATAAEYFDLRLFVNDVPAGDYKAHPYQRENGNVIYLFNADEVIRQFMPAIDDYTSLLNQPAQVSNMQSQIKIQKKKPTDISFTDVDIFLAINAARQIGGAGESLNDLVANNENLFVFVGGQPGYIYVYDNQFVREKQLLTNSANVTVNGITKFVEVLPYCDGDVVLKYLDKNGMYRFYKFSRFYARNVRGELIGSVENLFTSLSTGQGYKKNIGYNAQEELTVKANGVPAEHMESLQDIYTSARVYMHIGLHGEDALKDWVLVDVEGDGLIKHNKRQFNDIELTIKPPKRNNVTML